MQVSTVVAPAYWASYLINGDASGLTDDEKHKADAWLTREGLRRSDFVDCSEEARFTWYMALYAPECGCSGGDVLDYTVLTHE